HLEEDVDALHVADRSTGPPEVDSQTEPVTGGCHMRIRPAVAWADALVFGVWGAVMHEPPGLLIRHQSIEVCPCRPALRHDLSSCCLSHAGDRSHNRVRGANRGEHVPVPTIDVCCI